MSNSLLNQWIWTLSLVTMARDTSYQCQLLNTPPPRRNQPFKTNQRSLWDVKISLMMCLQLLKNLLSLRTGKKNFRLKHLERGLLNIRRLLVLNNKEIGLFPEKQDFVRVSSTMMVSTTTGWRLLKSSRWLMIGKQMPFTLFKLEILFIMVIVYCSRTRGSSWWSKVIKIQFYCCIPWAAGWKMMMFL